MLAEQNLLTECTTRFIHAWCNLRLRWARQAWDCPTVAFFFKAGSIPSTRHAMDLPATDKLRFL